MAECAPPMFDMHPMRVLFMIPKMPTPKLKDASKWSPVFHDFLEQCLQKDPDQRPEAERLLQHPFMTGASAQGNQVIMELIERGRAAKRERSREEAEAEAEANEQDQDGDEEGEDDEEEEYSTVKEKLENEEGYGTVKPKKKAGDGPSTTATLVKPAAGTADRASTIRTTVKTAAGSTPDVDEIARQLNQVSVSPIHQSVVNKSQPLNAQNLVRPTTAASVFHEHQTFDDMPRLPAASVAKKALSQIGSQNLVSSGSGATTPTPYGGRATNSQSHQSIGTPALSSKPLAPFKAARICRLGRKVHCAEYIGDVLLLSLDEGLFAYESVTDPGQFAPAPKMYPLSTRRYVQLDFVDEIGGIMLSRSGKHDSICVHDVRDIDKARMKKRFEAETKVRKLERSKDCDYYGIGRVRGDVYLGIAQGKSVLVMKWAPQPLWKFMKVKVENVWDVVLL